jgi:hypothetical protein
LIFIMVGGGGEGQILENYTLLRSCDRCIYHANWGSGTQGLRRNPKHTRAGHDSLPSCFTITTSPRPPRVAVDKKHRPFIAPPKQPPFTFYSVPVPPVVQRARRQSVPHAKLPPALQA